MILFNSKMFMYHKIYLKKPIKSEQRLNIIVNVWIARFTTTHVQQNVSCIHVDFIFSCTREKWIHPQVSTTFQHLMCITRFSSMSVSEKKKTNQNWPWTGCRPTNWEFLTLLIDWIFRHGFWKNTTLYRKFPHPFMKKEYYPLIDRNVFMTIMVFIYCSNSVYCRHVVSLSFMSAVTI